MRLPSFLLAIGLVAFRASADTLAGYTFDDLTGNPAAVAAGLSASVFSGSNLTFSSGIGNPGGAASSTGWTSKDADPAHFLSFTLTPHESITITILTLSAARENTGPYSLSMTREIGDTEILVFQTALPGSLAASITQHFNLTVSEPVTFRFYAWNAPSESGAMLLDNIVLSGTSTIPEPSTFMLFAAGFAFVAFRALRRRIRSSVEA